MTTFNSCVRLYETFGRGNHTPHLNLLILMFTYISLCYDTWGLGNHWPSLIIFKLTLKLISFRIVDYTLFNCHLVIPTLRKHQARKHHIMHFNTNLFIRSIRFSEAFNVANLSIWSSDLARKSEPEFKPRNQVLDS